MIASKATASHAQSAGSRRASRGERMERNGKRLEVLERNGIKLEVLERNGKRLEVFIEPGSGTAEVRGVNACDRV